MILNSKNKRLWDLCPWSLMGEFGCPNPPAASAGSVSSGFTLPASEERWMPLARLCRGSAPSVPGEWAARFIRVEIVLPSSDPLWPRSCQALPGGFQTLLGRDLVFLGGPTQASKFLYPLPTKAGLSNGPCSPQHYVSMCIQLYMGRARLCLKANDLHFN